MCKVNAQKLSVFIPLIAILQKNVLRFKKIAQKLSFAGHWFFATVQNNIAHLKSRAENWLELSYCTHMAATFEHQTQIWKYIPSLSQGLIPQWLYLFQSLGCWWNNYFLQKNYSCKKVYSLKALFFARWRIQIDWKWREHAWAFKISSIHYRSFTDLILRWLQWIYSIMIYQTLFCNGFNGFISFQSLGYSWRNRICLRKVCCNEVVKAMKKTANTMRQSLV